MPASPGSPCRTLVVEDDRSIAGVHCRFVSRQRGFQVVGVALTVPDAREMIANLRPDLLLLDLALRGGSGLELLRELRASGSPLDVIVVTAHSTPELVRRSMQLGVLDYLVKPFWPERLAEALTGLSARNHQLAGARPLDQETIDRVRNGGSRAGEQLASGIRRDRLDAVRAELDRRARSLTAEEVAQATGIARVTARRYLEHLVALGVCTVDSHPNGPGRPRKAYRLWRRAPIGSLAGWAE